MMEAIENICYKMNGYEEKEFLCSLVKKYHIESGNTDGKKIPITQKKLWEDLTMEFQAATNSQKTKEQLQKAWKNLKQKAFKRNKEINRNSYGDESEFIEKVRYHNDRSRKLKSQKKLEKQIKHSKMHSSRADSRSPLVVKKSDFSSMFCNENCKRLENNQIIENLILERSYYQLKLKKETTLLKTAKLEYENKKKIFGSEC